MEFDPNYYNDFTDSIEPANRLINIIQDFQTNNDIDQGIILDIGCGTGSTTKLLNAVNCQHIIGCDIDPKMVSFAQKFNKTPKIEYLVQDFGADWNQFDERLKRLAGKVSVIFTNYAMAWIWDKQTGADNIARLLAPDGKFVANILYDGDIFQCLPTNERQKAREVVPYPTEQEFIGGWIMALKKAGLSKLNIDYYEPKIVMSEQLYVEEFIEIPMNWFKHYSTIKNGNNQDINRLIKQLIFQERCTPLDPNNNENKLIEIINRLWQFVAQKSS